MSKVDPFENNLSKLRKKAEEKIISQGKRLKNLKQDELEHELSVHKIELEMQNQELLETQAKLLKSIDDYTEVFNYAPVGYFILNKNGKIVKLNEAGCKLLGLENNKVIGKHFSTFLGSESHQDHYFRHRTMVIESGKANQLECEIIRKDKSPFSAIIESSILKDEHNKFKYFLSIVSDITQRKEQEHKVEVAFIKERELSERKSQFISTASHEFRTPLAAILSSADLMERYTESTDDKKKGKHYLRIKTAVTRLKDILNGFLSFEHLEKGIIKNNPITFNLDKFIEEIIDEVKINNTTHSFVYKHPVESGMVTLDNNLLRICLTNLIGNAIKYSPVGSKIEIVSRISAADKLKLSIKDSGCGISEYDQPRVFEKFYRAKNAQTIQGVGIGLSITKDIVALMNGEISFESKENVGSTFSLSFHKVV